MKINITYGDIQRAKADAALDPLGQCLMRKGYRNFLMSETSVTIGDRAYVKHAALREYLEDFKAGKQVLPTPFNLRQRIRNNRAA